MRSDMILRGELKTKSSRFSIATTDRREGRERERTRERSSERKKHRRHERLYSDRHSHRQRSRSAEHERDVGVRPKPKSKVAVVIRTQQKPTVASTVWSRINIPKERIKMRSERVHFLFVIVDC